MNLGAQLLSLQIYKSLSPVLRGLGKGVEEAGWGQAEAGLLVTLSLGVIPAAVGSQ